MLRAVFPPQCMNCGALVDEDFALCPDCWRDAAFIRGLVCDRCGVPLPGEAEGHAEYCDECLSTERPWARGRAAILYRGTGRSLVLALKHGDRQDLASAMAGWMVRAGADLIGKDTIIAPVPLHRWRLLRRRFNQSALLALAIARQTGADCCPDLLLRVRATQSQDGRGREERFANLVGAIRLHPGRSARLRDRPVLIVDDVMTSGATLSTAAEACLAGGASEVSVLVLARVAKDA